MAWVTLSLGSNVDAAGNITIGLDRLAALFQNLAVSSVFESEAVGFEGDNFLNMAVGFHTELPLAELSTTLKKIEDDNGRDRSQPKFCGRALDIDILTYGDLHGVFSGIRLPRAEITENAYVLWPLAEISGSSIHPESRQSYARLWRDYDKARQRLWPVDFAWQGKLISRSL
ncbi:MAG: 2-amino-4-hydroxy-6-hydroxymethyldihydropteridine diphosphokinase [Pseudomonadales bacterium]|nr:2-amino-4-hydroxy-6-hydroxymethyldihydropteridine diphosphokinase [Pseudomonadales bacterium]